MMRINNRSWEIPKLFSSTSKFSTYLSLPLSIPKFLKPLLKHFMSSEADHIKILLGNEQIAFNDVILHLLKIHASFSDNQFWFFDFKSNPRKLIV